MIKKKVKQRLEKKPERYAEQYSPLKFSSKLPTLARRLGLSSVVCAYILYHLLAAKTTPSQAKLVIIVTLGYVITPLDLIPDFIFGFGLVDDIAALNLAMIKIKKTMMDYVTPSILKQAAVSTKKVFKTEPYENIISIINSLELYDEPV